MLLGQKLRHQQQRQCSRQCNNKDLVQCAPSCWTIDYSVPVRSHKEDKGQDMLTAEGDVDGCNLICRFHFRDMSTCSCHVSISLTLRLSDNPRAVHNSYAIVEVRRSETQAIE